MLVEVVLLLLHMLQVEGRMLVLVGIVLQLVQDGD